MASDIEAMEQTFHGQSREVEMVNFDDPVKDPKREWQRRYRRQLPGRILEHIRVHRPELLSPGVRVDAEYVAAVEQADADLAGDAIEGFEWQRDDEVVTLALESLPDSFLTMPGSRRTVGRMLRAIEQAHYHTFLRDTSRQECGSNPSCLNNRANARAVLGRDDEALEDYDRACELAPQEIMFRMNRARQWPRGGMRHEALQDAHWILERLEGSRVGAVKEGPLLAKVFLTCRQHQAAISAIRMFVTAFRRALLHEVSTDRRDECQMREIRIGDTRIMMSPLLDDLSCSIRLIKRLDRKKKVSVSLRAAIDSLKMEIIFWCQAPNVEKVNS